MQRPWMYDGVNIGVNLLGRKWHNVYLQTYEIDKKYNVWYGKMCGNDCNQIQMLFCQEN